jgi:enoyl-CoA hydratase/carnithine racemase
MGKRDIAYLALTGEDFDAHEAKAMGWINKVVPHDRLMSEVYVLCNKLKDGPPIAQEVTKRILNRRAHEDYDSYIEIIAALFATEDVAEARRAFMEKRKPVFKGK